MLRSNLAGTLASTVSEWFTTEEAADYLRISAGSVRNMTSNGKLPFYKLERRNRYRRGDLEQILLSKRRGPNGNQTLR